MKGVITIDFIIHKLLFEKQMNGFTVRELRDASINLDTDMTDPEEARKRVYRQILRFERNNWLRCEGAGREKRYFTTDEFHSKTFMPKNKTSVNQSLPNEPSGLGDYDILSKERSQYQGELEITLGEIEECQSLLSRFPELNQPLQLQLREAQSRSAKLLGKVNVITRVLESIAGQHIKC